MTTDRLSFIESVSTNSPVLQTIFLNHSGAPSNMLTDISSIDFLADKITARAFKNFCLNHPLVKGLTISPKFRRTEITVELNDNSEIKFKLIHSMIRRSLDCLDIKTIKKEAFVNEHGMLVASHHHHFDYLVIMNQYAQHTMPERYKNYFSSFDPELRTKIFRYIQPKYDLVLNTLDELYKPGPTNLIRINIGLRKAKRNSLFKMLLRVAEYGLFNFLGILTKKNQRLNPLNSRKTKSTSHKIKRSARIALY